MELRIKVNVSLDSLLYLQAQVAGMGRVPPPPRFAQMFAQWAKRYETFVRRRFVIQSRGGGEWAPLAKSTVERRRGPLQSKRLAQIASGKRRIKSGEATFLARDTERGGRLVPAAKSYAILRDTGILFNALAIRAYGNKMRPIPYGVVYGFAQTPHGANGPTIAGLAAIHHRGNARRKLPARKILVQPDAATQIGMTNDAARAIRDILGGQFAGRRVR